MFAVSSTTYNPVSLLDNPYTNLQQSDSLAVYSVTHTGNGFYSLEDAGLPDEAANAITAVVHGTQTLVNGSTVKLRLVSDVLINGTLIPRDHFLFGVSSLNGERLQVVIKGIRYQNALFPVELSVYDLDGMAGIYIPGAITRDVAKQSADRAVQSLNLNTLDASLGAQAASAGIEAARTLLGKRVKRIEVTVKADYRVLLWDQKQQGN